MKNVNNESRKLLYVLILVLATLLGTALWFLLHSVKQLPTDYIYTLVLAEPLSIAVNGQKYEIDLEKEGVYFDLEFLTSEVPTQFLFEGEGWKRFDVSVMGIPVIDGVVEIFVPEITDDFDIAVSITPQNSVQERLCYFNTRPANMEKLEVQSSNPSAGFYYFALLSGANNYAIKMNHAGQIVTYIHALTGIYDFKPTQVEDRIFYSYLRTYSEYELALNGLIGGSELVVFDEQYNRIDTVYATMPSERYPSQGLDAHDATILGDKHYLVASYYQQKVPKPEGVQVAFNDFGAEITSTLVQEIKDGQLIWQWDSADYPELFSHSIELNDFYNTQTRWTDYIHWNSIDVDPSDNNIICSFRNLDAVIKIDRITGEMIWVLGGVGDQFGMTEQQKFRRQHFARVQEDGSLTIFDNANDMPIASYFAKKAASLTMEDPTSRVLRLHLDEENKTITKYESYSVGKQYSPAMGSAQLLDSTNNRYLVGWGMNRDVEPLLSEVSFDLKETYFSIYTKTPKVYSYRAYKHEY